MNVRQMLVLGALGLPLPISLAAQRPLPLTPGQRVRVTASSAGMPGDVATVVEITADTLVLERLWAGQPLRSAVPLSAVQTLETSLGRRGHAFSGAFLGGLLGVVVSKVTMGGNACPGTFGPCLTPTIPPVLGVIFGAIIGGAGTAEGWEPVPLSRIRIGLAGRLGLGAAFSF